MSLEMTTRELFDAMLHELGLTRAEFDRDERSRFELSPRSWMTERLAKLGWCPVQVARILGGKDAA